MNELKPEARSLVEAARGAESPSQTDRARIKRGVLVQVALLGAASTATGSAVAMSLATKITLVGLSVAAIGGGAVSLWKWQEHPSAPRAPAHQMVAKPKATPIAPPTVEAIPAESPQVPPVEPRPRDVVKTPTRRSTAVDPVAHDVPAPSPIRPLEAELAVLRQAQDDLRAGLPAQALRRLGEFEQHHGPGSLGQERQAIAAIALCQARPGPTAQARAETFLRSTPESPLAARVRSACEKAKAPENQSNETERPREP